MRSGLRRRCLLRRYETGFNGFDGQGSHPSTPAQYTAFANTTMLQRMATFIANGSAHGGNPPIIAAWGLAGVLRGRHLSMSRGHRAALLTLEPCLCLLLRSGRLPRGYSPSMGKRVCVVSFASAAKMALSCADVHASCTVQAGLPVSMPDIIDDAAAQGRRSTVAVRLLSTWSRSRSVSSHRMASFAPPVADGLCCDTIASNMDFLPDSKCSPSLGRTMSSMGRTTSLRSCLRIWYAMPPANKLKQTTARSGTDLEPRGSALGRVSDTQMRAEGLRRCKPGQKSCVPS